MRQQSPRLPILDSTIEGLLLNTRQPILEVICEVIPKELFEESRLHLAECISTALLTIEGVDLLPGPTFSHFLFHTHRSA